MVEIIVSSLYNESVYHLLRVKRGAIMKKLFLLLTIFSLFTISAFAVSLDELRNSPERYKLVLSNPTTDQYVEIPSINVVRYSPPYYVINSRTHIVRYEDNIITSIDMTYFYDYNQSIASLANKVYTVEELLKSLKNDSGIKFQMKGHISFYYDGSQIGTYTKYSLSNPKYGPQKSDITSASYDTAAFTFYKAYNMYFNQLFDEDLFER